MPGKWWGRTGNEQKAKPKPWLGRAGENNWGKYRKRKQGRKSPRSCGNNS